MAAARAAYVETFDAGPGGWFGRNVALEVKDGVASSSSPWWIDANHAPFYLHLPFILYTGGSPASRAQVAKNRTLSGANAFVAQGASTDLRNARGWCRAIGSCFCRGAQDRSPCCCSSRAQ
eukprot:SAG31_NODE_8747_length_1395_cov_1.679784_2_plen_121_part_00